MQYIIFLLLSISIFQGCSKKSVTKRPPVNVEAAKATQKKIPIFIESIGLVKAYNHVKIKSQVEGWLEKLHFEEGTHVNEGDLLFTIDPRQYEAAVEEAEGKLLKYESDLVFALDRVERYGQLVADNYVSQIEFDQYTTNVAMLEASILSAKGALEKAKLDLEYCYIRSPINGLAGKKLVDPGNLVANDGSKLLVINQLQPVFVDFSVPEKDLITVLQMERKKELRVLVTIPNSKLDPFEGKLVLVDNAVDNKTGMIPLRAEFANQMEYLWPEQFVRVKLILEEKPDAILVPETAVNMGQKGEYVVLISEDKKASIKQVQTGEKVGSFIEVTNGVKKGEMVITNGQLLVREGSEVNIKKVHR